MARASSKLASWGPGSLSSSGGGGGVAPGRPEGAHGDAGIRQVVLDGGAQREIGIGDLTRSWFGDYVILWKPNAGGSSPLSLGARSARVKWLRDSLRRVNGLPAEDAGNDRYDAGLVTAYGAAALTAIDEHGDAFADLVAEAALESLHERPVFDLDAAPVARRGGAQRAGRPAHGPPPGRRQHRREAGPDRRQSGDDQDLNHV